MKSMIAALLLFATSNAFAGHCADAYNQAVGNTDIFKFDDEGKVTVLKPQEVIINEKKIKSHKLTIKAGEHRVQYVVRYDEGRVSSIQSGVNHTFSFHGECQQEDIIEMNTEGKIKAVELDKKADTAK